MRKNHWVDQSKDKDRWKKEYIVVIDFNGPLKTNEE